MRSSTNSAIEVANKRNEFVIEGISKAMELNVEKDKTEVSGLLDQVKIESIVRSIPNSALREQLEV